MRKLDKQEEKIIRELIRNPRITDNQVSKRTEIPVMTINRKRKKLESEGLIHYLTHLKRSDNGISVFNARQLYIIKLRSGLTEENFMKLFEEEKRIKSEYAKHIRESYLGEKDGHLALVMIVDGKNPSDIIKFFNGKIVPTLKNSFGEDIIVHIFTTRLTFQIRRLYNYIPFLNLENGKIKDNWLDEYIFVN